MGAPIRIGILYSTRGGYGAIGRDCRDGAALAISRFSDVSDIKIEPIFVDPEGDPARYVEHARQMLRDHGCRHIIGTVLSASRKDVTPAIEKHDGMLWYSCPYEGFEANESIIYTGACPNQHLLPVLDYLVPRHGGRVFLLGANYVWGWEMNRLARELLVAGGHEVVGERFLPIEETDVGRLITEIRAQRPSFILNNLIGPSSYTFLSAMRELGREDAAFLPENCPVVSCDLAECELGEIAHGAAVGQLSAACYFDSLDTPENHALKALAGARYGTDRKLSTHFAGAYVATTLCVEAIIAAGTDEPAAVRRALCARPHRTVQGLMRVDPETNHTALPFYLGRINAEGGFDVISSRQAVPADPYLTGMRSLRTPSPYLRVVS